MYMISQNSFDWEKVGRTSLGCLGRLGAAGRVSRGLAGPEPHPASAQGAGLAPGRPRGPLCSREADEVAAQGIS